MQLILRKKANSTYYVWSKCEHNYPISDDKVSPKIPAILIRKGAPAVGKPAPVTIFREVTQVVYDALLTIREVTQVVYDAL